MRAKATNFYGDTATSQRIYITIDIEDNKGLEEESSCRIIYDENYKNPTLEFFEPLKENPYLVYIGLDAKIVYQGEFDIKDISNEIKIDLSIFEKGMMYILAVPNVKGCRSQRFIAR